MVRIFTRGGEEAIARGVVVDEKGTVLSDRMTLAAHGTENFDVVLSSGERVRAVLTDVEGAIAVVELRLGTSTPSVATIADASTLKLGQSVIRIGGNASDTVGVGVVASLPSSLIEAGVASAGPGSVLMTIFGEIVGIATGDSQARGSTFYSVPTPATSP
jgi:hypothetical protein